VEILKTCCTLHTDVMPDFDIGESVIELGAGPGILQFEY
jgi:hypothetical protein